MSALEPIPGRGCGDCSACCTELAIDDPALRKPQGIACRHLCAGAAGACGIYEARPAACRDWHCGWRAMGSLSEAMRPDRSGVMLAPELDPARSDKGGLTLIPLGDDPAGLLTEELVDLAAKCVAAGVPIFVAMGQGADCKRLFINPILEPAARAGDRADFVRRLRQASETLAESAARPAAPRAWTAPSIRIRTPGGEG
jgi:hypothetical protein